MQITEKLGKRLFIAIVLIGGVLLIGHELEVHLPDLETWVSRLGFWAPLGFMALFVGLSPVFVSIDALCFAAGLLFSLASAELYVLIATYVAAAVIFFIGRYVFRERVAAFIRRHRTFATMDAQLTANPCKLMFLLRLTPMPFALLSYAFSVTRVRFWPYLVSTSGILLYNASMVYFGYAAKHVAGLMSGKAQAHVSYPLLVGLSLLLLVLVLAVTKAGKSLRRLPPNLLD